MPFGQNKRQKYGSKEINGLTQFIAFRLVFKLMFCIVFKNNQLQRFMQAYIEDSNDVTLKYTEAFNDDPVKELRKTLKQPFYVTTKT